MPQIDPGYWQACAHPHRVAPRVCRCLALSRLSLLPARRFQSAMQWCMPSRDVDYIYRVFVAVSPAWQQGHNQQSTTGNSLLSNPFTQSPWQLLQALSKQRPSSVQELTARPTQATTHSYQAGDAGGGQQVAADVMAS